MSTIPPNETMDTPSDVHLPWFWTLWRRNHQWRDKLNQQMLRKALDIPDDDMNITQTKTGISAAGAMGIATAAGIPGILAAAALGYALLKSQPPSVPPVAPPAALDENILREFEILFWDRDGNPVPVQHISKKPVG